MFYLWTSSQGNTSRLLDADVSGAAIGVWYDETTGGLVATWRSYQADSNDAASSYDVYMPKNNNELIGSKVYNYVSFDAEKWNSQFKGLKQNSKFPVLADSGEKMTGDVPTVPKMETEETRKAKETLVNAEASLDHANKRAGVAKENVTSATAEVEETQKQADAAAKILKAAKAGAVSPQDVVAADEKQKEAAKVAEAAKAAAAEKAKVAEAAQAKTGETQAAFDKAQSDEAKAKAGLDTAKKELDDLKNPPAPQPATL
ncbi:MAG: hypothetical protein Q4A71_01145 [Actinomycetaceae bacterium]|nr:hypothetical protein [Actinomycetaceae bacterium]